MRRNQTNWMKTQQMDRINDLPHETIGPDYNDDFNDMTYTLRRGPTLQRKCREVLRDEEEEMKDRLRQSDAVHAGARYAPDALAF